MGRAEKRRAERFERIENRKGKVAMSIDEIRGLKRTIANDVSRFDVEALMTCFALAEHRLYGFDEHQIFESLQYIDQLYGEVLEDRATIDDYRDELEREVGVIVRF